jgi:hypothetical protein
MPTPNYRSELTRWAAQTPWTYAVTLPTNDTLALTTLTRRLKRWDAGLNRKLLGPRWLRHPDQRLEWLAVPESVGTNAHAHLVVRIADTHIHRFPELAVTEWQKITPSAGPMTHAIHPYASSGWLEYMTKSNADGFVLSRELH